MSWIFEKINEFQVLIYTSTSDGEIQLSKHKILILFLYIGSFILTFIHFATIPPEIVVLCQDSAITGESCSIPPSRFSGLAVLFYLYIILVAITSIYKGGSLPNFLSRPQLPSLRNRYKILLGVLFLLYGGIIIIIAFLVLFYGTLVLIYTGPLLYIIWMILEPFFLLSGILAIIRLIDTDYHLEGFTKIGKRSLTLFLFLGYLISGIISVIFQRTSGVQFIEVSVFGISVSFYQLALESFSRTITSVLTLTLLFLIVWWVKDRYRGASPLRERKKGMLPWFLGLTLVYIVLNIVPLIASTSGSLQEITSIIDIGSLFVAVGLGLWNTLGVEQVTEPMHSIKRLNPLEFIPRLHPYTKALFLLVISMLAFYSSVESSTIAALTGLPDIQKLQKLNILAGLIGWAFVVIIWRYKGQPRSTTPGLLKSAKLQFHNKLAHVKSIIEKESFMGQIDQFEEE